MIENKLFHVLSQIEKKTLVQNVVVNSLEEAIQEIKDMQKAYHDLNARHFSVSLPKETWNQILLILEKHNAVDG